MPRTGHRSPTRDSEPRPTPTQVEGAAGVVRIHAGCRHLSGGRGGSSMLTGNGGNSSGGGFWLPPEVAGGRPSPTPPGVAARIVDEIEPPAVGGLGDRPARLRPPLVAIRVPPADEAVLGQGGAPSPEVSVMSP